LAAAVLFGGTLRVWLRVFGSTVRVAEDRAG